MEKYISLDRALELMKGFTDRENGNPHFFHGLETYKEWLEYLGEIEGIEMTRCENCICYNRGYCEMMDARVKATDFCPWGCEE